MSDLTIHCAACHNFVAPTAAEGNLLGSAVEAALLPDSEECLSCHVMRTLVELPDPDPHGGGCAACHNPHTQQTPAEAAGSCAAAGCHDETEALTPFHVGLDDAVAVDCLYCHQAHDFALTGSDCASCHEGAGAPPAPGALLDFAHGEHESVSCQSCHVSTEGHATVSLATVQDCRSCHHTEPVSAACSTCHTSDDAPAQSFMLTQSMSLSVAESVQSRSVTFPHDTHASLDCASCHTDGLALEVTPDLDCASCHEDHHTAESDCASCHASAPIQAHPPTQAHLTCSGSGCHTDVPFETVPRTRTFCLGCHQDLADHEPDGTCVTCHQLPAPLPQGGGLP